MSSVKASLTRYYKGMHSSKNDARPAYKCPACDNSFTRNYNVLKHIDKNHKEECGTCSG